MNKNTFNEKRDLKNMDDIDSKHTICYSDQDLFDLEKSPLFAKNTLQDDDSNLIIGNIDGFIY